MERELEVERLRAGGVRVSVRVPLVLRRWQAPVSVGATASLGRGEVRRLAADHGQAALELVALLPALVAVGLAVLQLLAVGYASVLAASAAEAGALALAAGTDARAGVKEALPGWSRGSGEDRACPAAGSRCACGRRRRCATWPSGSR